MQKIGAFQETDIGATLSHCGFLMMDFKSSALDL